MASIMLSIRKTHCDALFSGEKKFEFRKSIPSHPISSIFVYESKGCGMVIGELKIGKSLIGTPEEIWLLTRNQAGIDSESFFNYYDGKKQAIAYAIDSYIRYEKPKNLSDFGVSRPPQNFIWIS